MPEMRTLSGSRSRAPRAYLEIAAAIAVVAISLNPLRPLSPNDAPAVDASPLDALENGKRYDVCEACSYKELTTIPWNDLTPGSVVNIYARAAPYRTKIALRVSGTATAPIVVNGVSDAAGRLPVLSGDGAVTATSNRNSGIYSDAHSEYGEGLALILIKRASTDRYGYKPRFLVIRNLELRDTYERSFSSQSDMTKRYEPSVAAIWADVVEDLLIEGNVITGHAFGVFINNKNAENGADAETSRRVTLRQNRIFGNGRVNSYLEHNVYGQGVQFVYESNFIGALRPGAEGSSLKDRSSDTVVRNNTIECAARCLDLVEDESGSSAKRDSPTALAANYDRALVTGNSIVSNISATSCIHFGGDNLGEGAGPFPTYRNGPLIFTDNSCTLNVNAWRASVFDIQHVGATVEASGNTIVFGGKSEVRSWLRLYGNLTLGENDAPPLADASDRARPGEYLVRHATLRNSSTN
jgi:hypothetical protein